MLRTLLSSANTRDLTHNVAQDQLDMWNGHCTKIRRRESRGSSEC